jgi:sirohydrochlorin ferrochelatase
MRPAPVTPRRFGYGDRESDRVTVVLVAHGSRDPRAAASTTAVAGAVAAARPDWDVHASYLDHSLPRPAQVLAGVSRAVVVPLLLTSAYHGRIDVPGEIAKVPGVRADLTDVLGPASPLLLDALIRRLPVEDLDAVVLASAGTRDAAARGTVGDAAAALGARLGVPALASFASAASPTSGEAVARLRAAGARRVGVASYFLAPGRLYDKAVESAVEAGAVAVAEPLGAAPELVRLIESRVEAVARIPLAA